MSHDQLAPFSRRSFLRIASGAGVGLLVGVPVFSSYPSAQGIGLHRHGGQGTIIHPDPRPDIDSSLVLTDEQLAGMSDEIKEIFANIREIPHIADGIGCSCPCITRPNYRSLLTCHYADGMARYCDICQGESKLVYRRFKEGQTLAQIRRAIDARFG